MTQPHAIISLRPDRVEVPKGWPGARQAGALLAVDGFEVKGLRATLHGDDGIVILPRGSQYRAYWSIFVSSYSTAFGAGGHCLHTRLYALRDDRTGQAFRPTDTPEAMFEEIKRADSVGEIMPCTAGRQ